jgi:hypothetical protein
MVQGVACAPSLGEATANSPGRSAASPGEMCVYPLGRAQDAAPLRRAAETEMVRNLYRACMGCDGVIRPRPVAGVLVTVSLGRGATMVPLPRAASRWLRHLPDPGLFSVAPSGAKPECSWLPEIVETGKSGRPANKLTTPGGPVALLHSTS